MKPEKRIDRKSSRTAAYTCMCRASSFLEKTIHLKSGDWVAVELLPKFIKLLTRFHILNLRGRISPRGIYQYVIARTKYIDTVFENAIESGFKQVVILGAGFDSRAIRFTRSNGAVKVFEIDTGHTQDAKIKQLKKRNIQVPANNIYIPVDFEKEDLSTILNEHTFSSAEKTLFILEGLTMYLSRNTVRETFSFIYNHCSAGSLVVFDYIYADVLRREHNCYGEEDIYNRVKKDKEKWTFGIEKGEIENFLNDNHFSLVEHFDAITLENKYFKDDTGSILEKINGTHCIVLARKNN